MADELKFDVIPNHNGDSGLGTTDTELLLQSKSPHDDEAVWVLITTSQICPL
jgi:hypothetical protein